MLNIGTTSIRHNDAVTRRDLLRVGSLGVLGFSLADWFRSNETRAADPMGMPGKGDAACIFIFLSGGPSHFETFDPKPNAALNVRGPYGAIPTNAPGIHICELLPMLSQHMDKCAIVRSMTSKSGDHSGVHVLSGGNASKASLGAVIAKLKGPTKSAMMPFVHAGPAGYIPGAGSLGADCNPVLVADPTGKHAALPQITLAAGTTADRFAKQRELLTAVDQARAELHKHPAVENMQSCYQQAVELLTSKKARAAFDLSAEKETLRNRYGGSTFGQSCLLARRLVEAGTRFVQVNWYSEPAWHGWDVHGADLPGLERMETVLCPRLDQGLSALLDDLQQRGLLKSTLVVVTGEFGRTPQINKSGGRDHWPQCFSVLLAGGGIKSGTVVGASDRDGASPAYRPVTVSQLAATVYQLAGIDTSKDERIRPYIGTAMPVAELIH